MFDRFLARIALELWDSFALKGGLALELRIQRARTTKDIDLRVMGAPSMIEAPLRTAATTDTQRFRVMG